MAPPTRYIFPPHLSAYDPKRTSIIAKRLGALGVRFDPDQCGDCSAVQLKIMQRFFCKQTQISWVMAALILPVALLGLVSSSISHAQSLKQDILGFFLGMPQVEVDKQLSATRCQTVSRQGSSEYPEIVCAINKDDRLKLKMVKGMVSGLETYVVKRVEFIFQSNEGPQRVVDKISTQFGSPPPGLQEQFHNCSKIDRKYCRPGNVAGW
jgi:hypothetical protein